MKKALSIIGAIVLGAAAIVGTVYAVLYFQRKQKEREEDCYIDGECGCGCGDDDYEDYLDDAEDVLEDTVDDAEDVVEDAVEAVEDKVADVSEAASEAADNE